MFKKKTVFILGAGASYDYGYPIGEDLISDIIQNINDEVLMPGSKEFSNIQGAFNEIDLNRFKSNRHPSIGGGIGGQLGYYSYYLGEKAPYLKLPLYEIKEFKALQSALCELNPVSIDNFLRDNPSLQKAGQVMIIYSLLKKEDTEKFNRENKDDWYKFLMNDLLSGCADSPENIKDNKITFITFNYDLSLEYYLQHRLALIERFKDKAADYFNHFCERIIHVYGKLYAYDELVRYASYKGNVFKGPRVRPIKQGLYNRESEMLEKDWLNAERFAFAVKNLNEIELIREGGENKINKEAREAIEQAEDIIIIGFGFDRTNLTKLGLPSDYNEWCELLKDKTLYWLNYDGKKKGISAKFDEISRSSNFQSKIVISTSKSIVDAYQHDFNGSIY